MGILKFIFLLILFIYPAGELVRLQVQNSVWITPLDIGVTVLTGAGTMYVIYRKRKIKYFLLRPLAVFILVGFISLFINLRNYSQQEIVISSLYLFRFIAYSLIFFIVSQFDSKFKKKVINLLTIIGGLVVTFGYVQFAYYQNLRNLYYLGWDDHLYRMFSTFLDPNFVGAFFVLYFLLLTGLLFESLHSRITIRNIVFIFLWLLTLGAIYLTHSRSALVMLIFGSSVFFILQKRLIYIPVILLITGVVLYLYSHLFYIENINIFRSVSTQGRLETYDNALTVIHDHPLFGVGFNTYRYTQVKYGFRHGLGAEVSHADAGVENSLLFVLATTGFAGLLAYLYFWITILKKSLKEKTVFASLVCASSIGLIIDSFFINSLFFPHLMFWMWVLIGIMDYK